jgi:hypothetical protein
VLVRPPTLCSSLAFEKATQNCRLLRTQALRSDAPARDRGGAAQLVRLFGSARNPERSRTRSILAHRARSHACARCATLGGIADRLLCDSGLSDPSTFYCGPEPHRTSRPALVMRASPVKVELQPRDLAFLRGLFECRFMTIAHAASIFFGGRREMAKKRLQRLKAARLVRSRRAHGFAPSLVQLTALGLRALSSAGILRQYPSPSGRSFVKRTEVSQLTINHEIAVTDIKAAFHEHATVAGARIDQFSTWPTLHQFRSERRVVKPDAFIRLGTQTTSHCFYLELDRSTEPLGRLIRQAKAYRSCRKATRCLAPAAWDDGRGEHRFTVLYVLRNGQRLANFAKELLAATPPIRSLVWLTTQDALTKNPFGPIWSRPTDVVSGGPMLCLSVA